MPPILKALAISIFPVLLIALTTELPGLQRGLLTTSLTGKEWLACIGLAALLPPEPRPAVPAALRECQKVART